MGAASGQSHAESHDVIPPEVQTYTSNAEAAVLIGKKKRPAPAAARRTGDHSDKESDGEVRDSDNPHAKEGPGQFFEAVPVHEQPGDTDPDSWTVYEYKVCRIRVALYLRICRCLGS